MPVRRLAVVIGSYLLVSAPLAAQQPVPPAAAPQSSDSARADSAARRPDTPRELARVRVTASRTRGYAVPSTRSATRTDTPLRDTPQSATVLTHALIADQAMQSMADVVRYVPGITMGLGEGHRDQPTIRGNNSTADFFVDGVRDDAQYLRDVYNAERIEALKGPNAMVFGRGGGGGVLNRVTKVAGWAPQNAISLEGGSFDHTRGTMDLGQPLGEHVALRLNAMLEHSGGFRDRSDIRRRGINPTATILAGGGTTLQVGYEHFFDERTVDRGIPSFQGAPAPTPATTFFGDANANIAHVRVDAGSFVAERELGGGFTLRNHTRAVHYDKFYQNVLPGAVNAAGTQVSLSGYNNATTRGALFNQTDLTSTVSTGTVRHTLLAGAELSRQASDNLRHTGYFGTSTTLPVPLDDPTQNTGVAFRQSATDADNHSVTDVGALYVQDQLALSSRWQAVAGVRVDRFAMRSHNNRTGEDLGRVDRLVSPRAGLIYKPVVPMSLYASYGVSHLPSSGDQFSSLTVTTETLKPERFTNYELGAKWDALPGLSLTTALFRLDRTNSAAHDPVDATKTVQTGAQRTTGFELGVTGVVTERWELAGGYSNQRAEIVNATTAAPAGASVPLVPHTTLSLWNKVQLTRATGAGLGVVRQGRMFAAIDNSVTLPAFTRVDAALFIALPANLRAQLNVENLLDAAYFATAQGNNNILPGGGRTIRFSLAAGL